MADEPRLTGFGKLAILLFILACFAGGFYLFFFKPPQSGPSGGGGGVDDVQPASTQGRPDASPRAPENAVTIGVAYGTEKKRWLTWAAEEFKKDPKGRAINVKLIPLGSIEGAHKILAGDESIHVWTPASALYRHNLVDEWSLKHSGQSPIAKEESLALSPMVFVMWEERYQAFIAKYKELNFRTIAQALAEPGGWNGIAAKPEWGLFKFGHTHPNQSNSGLMTLVLLAYDFHDKTRDLQMADITNPAFQKWAAELQRGVSGLINSTGKMMEEMVARGPSTYDCLFVYENTAIDYVRNAEGRWGKLRIVYPAKNAWNDNPYYVLDVPWSTKEQRRAAQTFLEFLLSEPVQRQSLVHGFRPANVAVPIKSTEPGQDPGPFETLAAYGLKIDLPELCQTPAPEVINNLLLAWQRSRGPGG